MFAGNPFWMHPKTSNLVKSCNLMRVIIGKIWWWYLNSVLSNLNITDFFTHTSAPLWGATSWGGQSMNEKISHFHITQNWIEISPPNFHQLLTSSDYNFSPNLKFFGALKTDCLPKQFLTSQGRGRLIFWATTSKLCEKPFFFKMFNW